MQIAAHLAAREECGPNGYFLWAALIRIDDTLSWAHADCVGRGPNCSIAAAYHAGAVRLLKQLRDLLAQHPEASLMMLTDSRQLVQELSEKWESCATVALEDAVELVREMGWALTLRYCSRRENLVAHEVISALCKRHNVPVRERYIRQS
jgi:hypothetical protein